MNSFFSSKLVVANIILAAVLVVCFLYGYSIEPYQIEVSDVSLETTKLKHATIRVVQISDLHCDVKIRSEYKLSDLINPLNPDVIVFTGDLSNTPEALPHCKDALSRLNARLGKYAVSGNWDVWINTPDLFNDTGFVELKGESLELKKEDETFSITGLNYAYSDKQFDVLFNLTEDHYNILLYHNPDLIEDLKAVNVDLYLAGHTHGGQVALPFYGAIITLSKYGKKYEAGKYVVGKTILYVNRGIGMVGGMPRIRLFSRPEITVFEIKPKST